MIDDLFKLYKKESTFNGLVLKGSWKTKLTAIFIVLVNIIAIYYQYDIGVIFWELLIVMVLITTPIVVIGRFLNIRRTKELNFSNVSFWKFPHDQLHQVYLGNLKKNLTALFDVKPFSRIDPQKLDLLQKIIRERANEQKAPFILFSSLFILMFIATWAAFAASFFKSFENNPGEMIKLFLFLTFLSAAISLLPLYLIVIRDKVLSNYQHWNRLNRLIDELRLKEESMKSLSAKSYTALISEN